METIIWDSGISRKRLLQNITLLWTLECVPEEPKENSLSFNNGSYYRLSAQRECEIVSNLAFLSATADDYLRIMAVCIEEGVNGDAVTIRIASNTGDLSRVKNGFMTLGGILEQAAHRGNPKNEDMMNLFREVVKFDFLRILSRLRSLHAKRTWKTSGKPALIPQLNAALKIESIKATHEIPEDYLRDLQDRVEELVTLFTELERLPILDMEVSGTQEIFMAIITKAHGLLSTTTLAKALRISPFHDSGLVSYLIEAFRKLGRYYTAASELVCAARDRWCRLFLSVRIETYQIKVPRDLLAQNSSISINEVATTLFQPYDASERPENPLEDKLAKFSSRSEDKFREAITQTCEHGKVHAEIQLVLFYELHSVRLKPRVICSSKKACYLCNLFIQLHGQFLVPRTHGRLYEKWILPDWLKDVPAERLQILGTIVVRMNAVIEDKIRAVYLGTQKPFLHPNESDLVQPAHWPSTSDLPSTSAASSESTSTLRQETFAILEQGTSNNSVISEADTEDNFAPSFDMPIQQLSRIEPYVDTHSVRKKSVPDHEHHESKPHTEVIDELAESRPSNEISSVSSKTSSQICSTSASRHLIRGEPILRSFPTIGKSLLISTPSIYASVFVDRVERKEDDLPPHKDRMRLRLLPPNEKISSSTKGGAIVRLDELEAGRETAVLDAEILYLCHAGDILEMKYCPG